MWKFSCQTIGWVLQQSSEAPAACSKLFVSPVVMMLAGKPGQKNTANNAQNFMTARGNSANV